VKLERRRNESSYHRNVRKTEHGEDRLFRETKKEKEKENREIEEGIRDEMESRE
jgi:hypothetical protein